MSVTPAAIASTGILRDVAAALTRGAVLKIELHAR